mmetsp:Transcript_15612/g.27896  ORF Transcript_15612/g.27896 Transcript_15612/m.27896 type:complete len:773 (+) Transcript_15612:113-2431(+)
MFYLMYQPLPWLVTLATGLPAINAIKQSDDIRQRPANNGFPEDGITDEMYANADTSERDWEKRQAVERELELLEDPEKQQAKQHRVGHRRRPSKSELELLEDPEKLQAEQDRAEYRRPALDKQLPHGRAETTVDQNSDDAQLESPRRQQRLMRRERAEMDDLQTRQPDPVDEDVKIRKERLSAARALDDENEMHSQEHFQDRHGSHQRHDDMVDYQDPPEGQWFGRVTPQIFDKHLVAEKERRMAQRDRQQRQLANEARSRSTVHQRTGTSHRIDSEVRERGSQTHHSQQSQQDPGFENDSDDETHHSQQSRQDPGFASDSDDEDISSNDYNPYRGESQGSMSHRAADKHRSSDDAESAESADHGQELGDPERSGYHPHIDEDQAGPASHSNDPLDAENNGKGYDGSPGDLDDTDIVNNVGGARQDLEGTSGHHRLQHHVHTTISEPMDETRERSEGLPPPTRHERNPDVDHDEIPSKYDFADQDSSNAMRASESPGQDDEESGSRDTYQGSDSADEDLGSANQDSSWDSTGQQPSTADESRDHERGEEDTGSYQSNDAGSSQGYADGQGSRDAALDKGDIEDERMEELGHRQLSQRVSRPQSHVDNRDDSQDDDGGAPEHRPRWESTQDDAESYSGVRRSHLPPSRPRPLPPAALSEVQATMEVPRRTASSFLEALAIQEPPPGKVKTETKSTSKTTVQGDSTHQKVVSKDASHTKSNKVIKTKNDVVGKLNTSQVGKLMNASKAAASAAKLNSTSLNHTAAPLSKKAGAE